MTEQRRLIVTAHERAIAHRLSRALEANGYNPAAIAGVLAAYREQLLGPIDQLADGGLPAADTPATRVDAIAVMVAALRADDTGPTIPGRRGRYG